jgi:hypothetical protein
MRNLYPSISHWQFIRKLVVATCVGILIGCFVLLSQSTALTSFNATTSTTKPVATQDRKQKGRGQNCARCATPGNYEIYAPLLMLPEAKSSELVFNSRSPKETVVTPIFYKRDGTRFVGKPVTIESAEIRYVDVKKLLPPGQRDERDWGGVSLTYHGIPREMWAQLRFMGVNGGVNVDEFFVVKAENRSDVQQAVWWTPPESTSVIALGNVTNMPSGATLTFGNGGVHNVQLPPNGTEIIRHQNANSVESVDIRITGMPGSIIPTGVITAKNGFNSVIRFYDTKNTKQPHLFANGLRLGAVTPHMVLKNTGELPLVARPTVISAAGVAAIEPILLPAVSLNGGEVREIDLSTLVNKQGFDVISMKVSNSGSPGTLIGSIHAIENETGISYDTPLRDTGPVRAMTGSYPWTISNDFRTIVYVTNVSDQEAEFVGEINYRGGKAVVDPRKLQPGETATFDMRQIRAAGYRDSDGNQVPRTVSQGQFKWSVRGVTNGKHLLTGRAEMVSRFQQVSTSYSCNDPCPPYYAADISPFPPPVVFVNSTANATAKETAYYDSGYQNGPYNVIGQWSITNIASVSPSYAVTTTMTGITPGEGSIDAFIGIQQDYGWDGLNCYEYLTYEESATAPAEVQCRLPTGETTASGGWHSTITTAHNFNMTLTGPGTFVGRNIAENDGTGGTDTCHFQGSAIAKIGTTGGDWTVATGNTWGPDTVGYQASSITYYRQNGRAPCQATVVQEMFMDCPDMLHEYTSGNLIYGITATHITCGRHDVSQSKQWP